MIVIEGYVNRLHPGMNHRFTWLKELGGKFGFVLDVTELFDTNDDDLSLRTKCTIHGISYATDLYDTKSLSAVYIRMLHAALCCTY